MSVKLLSKHLNREPPQIPSGNVSCLLAINLAYWPPQSPGSPLGSLDLQSQKQTSDNGVEYTLESRTT